MEPWVSALSLHSVKAWGAINMDAANKTEA